MLFCSAWGQTQGITHAEYKLSYLLSKPLNLNNVNLLTITDLYLSSYFSLAFYLIIHYKPLPTILLLNLYSLDSIGNQNIKITVDKSSNLYVLVYASTHAHVCACMCRPVDLRYHLSKGIHLFVRQTISLALGLTDSARLAN